MDFIEEVLTKPQLIKYYQLRDAAQNQYSKDTESAIKIVNKASNKFNNKMVRGIKKIVG